MSNYTQTTNFATKDALASGNPLKVVKGTEINVEFANIATAVATKADLASPTFTGTVTIPTLAVTGTVTLTSPLGAAQGGTGVANNAAMTVTGSGNFAYTRTLTAATNVTLPTTGTLATLAGTETFTNKTLTSPVIGGTPTGVGVLTSGTAVASTSGTSIDFTSIPSWVKRVTVMFNGISTNGTSIIQFQLGAGSFTTSGYAGAGGNFNNSNNTGVANGSTGFYMLNAGNATNVYYGQAIFTTLGSNIWIVSGVYGVSTATNVVVFGGGITLGGTLDRVRITTVNGTDTFDAGSINILYE
jgi:hypothetical protein